MTILIAGGGISGLTLALALQSIGRDVRIFEATQRFEPIGAGINLLPHAVAILDALGLKPSLTERACQIQDLAFFNRHGQEIHREPRGMKAGHAWPQLAIHRGALHACLHEAIVSSSKIRLNMGMRLTGFEETASGVRATFFRDGRQIPIEGEMLIGCDGIRSAVRRQLHPHEGEPIFSGITMWRGTARARPFLTGRSMILAGALGKGKIVAYPILDAVDAQGDALINWVAEYRSPPPSDPSGHWDRQGSAADILPLFEDWSLPGLDVRDLIRRSSVVLRYPMVDRDPLPFWSTGRVTLLGDAAHPMYPFGSNGAGQAIMDVHALAMCLAADTDAAAALRRYDEMRCSATGKVVILNRSCPPDHILELVDRRTCGQRFVDRDAVIAPDEIADIGDRYKSIAGFSLEQTDGRIRFDLPSDPVRPNVALEDDLQH